MAFIGIFASHSGISCFEAGGSWGASVFFVLSGFLMFYSYYGTGRIKTYGLLHSIKFGVNKIKKIYPLHIVTMSMMVLLTLFVYRDNPGIIIKDISSKFIVDSLLLQSWFPNMDIYFSLNAVSWYLSVSVFLYIVFPAILFCFEKYRDKKTAVSVIVILLLLQFIMAFAVHYAQPRIGCNINIVHWFVYIFPLSRIQEFIIGCNLGYIFVKKKNNEKISDRGYTLLESGVLLLIAIELAVYLTAVIFFGQGKNESSYEMWWGLTVLWSLSSILLIYVFAGERGKISKWLSGSVFLHIGNLSASGFLIHFVVFRYLVNIEKIIFGRSDKYINIFLCFIITMICSYLWEKAVSFLVKKDSGF